MVHSRLTPLYNPRKGPNSLVVSLVARPGVVPYGHYTNLPLEIREPMNVLLPTAGELNAKMRSKKVFDFDVLFVQWETVVLDHIFLFNSPVKKRFFGSRFQRKIFYSAREEPNPVALRD